MVGDGYTENVFALEVVEEGAFGDAGGGAELVHRGGGTALGAYQAQSGIQQLASGGMSCFDACLHSIPTGWYVSCRSRIWLSTLVRPGPVFRGAAFRRH